MKNNIRIVVQAVGETGVEFAQRLENFCEELQEIHLETMPSPPFLLMSSAADGRQTATIQFWTKKSQGAKKKKSSTE